MKRLALALFVVFSIPASDGLIAESQTRPQAKFSGACLKWLYAAEPVLQREKLDLDKYKVSVTEEDGSVTVGLTSADCPEGWHGRGSCGSSPGFVVVISKEDMHVIRSNYVR